MQLLDGVALALAKEKNLATQIQLLPAGQRPHIRAILFREDSGSVLYTRLKKEAAHRVGIGYSVAEFSMTDPLAVVQAAIVRANHDPTITGIIIQKPWKQRYEQVVMKSVTTVSADYQQTKAQLEAVPHPAFATWWQNLVVTIDPAKDVDGLSPTTLNLVKAGEKVPVLPATCTAVLVLLTQVGVLSAEHTISAGSQRISILGKSDLLGTPLFWYLRHYGFADTELLGRGEIEARVLSGQAFHQRDVIVSATGRAGLITGDLIDSGVVLIDVGEPRGDVDRGSVVEKPAFLSPVPGGVGPLTVVSLLENVLQLWKLGLSEG